MFHWSNSICICAAGRTKKTTSRMSKQFPLELKKFGDCSEISICLFRQSGSLTVCTPLRGVTYPVALLPWFCLSM
jgi:hypothetical protein